MNPIATFWCAFWISLLTKPTAEVIPFPRAPDRTEASMNPVVEAMPS